MKNIIQALKVTTLAIILSFGISYVYAWTAPTATPPGGNVSAPINTSATAQYKDGAIGFGGLIRGYANAIFDGNVGIGTTAPGSKLEVVGDVISKGTSWTLRTSAIEGWVSVTYGNGLFVAVSNTGLGNRVMTSPDGIIWTSRVSAANNTWRSVTYGNGLFVAVAVSGTGNRVMTSPDGITWTTRTSAADNQWVSVTYGNGLFVAVAVSGTGNRVMTSQDGITWTTRTSAANNAWYSVTYGNGLFVAVSYDGVGNRVMTSPDGITWTIRTSAANNWWYSVTYGNGLFVAVAGSGVGNRVMTSPDGITWTIRTSAADNAWYSVTYGNGLFVAVAISGTGNRVMTSPDGITWTTRTSAADNQWIGVTYGNGIFVAVSNTGTGGRVMTSGKQDDQIVSHNNIYQGGMNIYGNVGIGTKSPTQTLDVVGNIKGTGLCIGTDCKTAWPAGGVTPPAGSEFLDTSATEQTKVGGLVVNTITSVGDIISKVATIYNGTIGGKISFYNTDNVTNLDAIAEIRTINASNNMPSSTILSHNSGGKLSFATKGPFSTLNERMIIDFNGNVGIGVQSPSQMLDVGGNIKGTGLCIGADCKTAWPAGGVNASLGAAYWYHPGCGYGGPCQCPDNSVMVGTYGWWMTYTDAYYLCRDILN
ncbi:MAG: hypothetical protein UV86_C0020G0002 [Candidatus Nomurabacteria bacterium GW2011_GWB1_43_20]|nr:MAG: hypothetical protein UV86_C0020G0002 [Candidatus Nomurabacteria bacterium GW2011_GWB1_43_20]